MPNRRGLGPGLFRNALNQDMDVYLSVHLESWNRAARAHRAQIAFRRLSVPIGQVCSQVWCRPYLVANFGIFELRTFPWSPSKAEVGTFYSLTLKAGYKYTYIILESSIVKPSNNVP